MGVLFELMKVFFAAFLFEFVIYLTGAIILRIIFFGALNMPIYSFGAFKVEKNKASKGFVAPSVTGFLFYAAVIVVIAWLN
jgi:hypothetical protein